MDDDQLFFKGSGLVNDPTTISAKCGKTAG